MNSTFIYSNAERTEELLPSLSYAELVRGLGNLTAIGVISPETPVAMLVVARLVDRGRIARSGMSAAELRSALDVYQSGRTWKPVYAVVRALEQAVATLENEAQSAT